MLPIFDNPLEKPFKCRLLLIPEQLWQHSQWLRPSLADRGSERSHKHSADHDGVAFIDK